MGRPKRATDADRDYIHLAHRREELPIGGSWRTKAMWILLLVAIVGATFSALFHPVALSWRPSDVANATYHIYRADGPCAAIESYRTKIGSTEGLSYTDSSIKFGTFCYTVRASLNGRESADSNPVEVHIRPTFRHRW